MIVPCPDCGAAVDTRGLHAHRNGRPCAVQATIRDALARGLVATYPYQGMLGAVEWIGSRFGPGWPRKRAKIQAQPWAPAALVALAEEMRQGGADLETRRTLLRAAVEQRALLPADEQLRQDLAAQSASTQAPVAGWERAAGVVYAVECTTTPEQTLRAAGIDDARHVEYQRKMSALFAARLAEAVTG